MKLTPTQVRARLVRKGVFTLKDIVHKPSEKEIMLYRKVLDYALFDLTHADKKKRDEVYEWLHEKTDFNEVCSFAELKPHYVEKEIKYCLKTYFPLYYEELTCFEKENMVY